MSERRPKKRPNVFAQVVANAEEVVQASFIASGPAPGVSDPVTSGSTFAPKEVEAPAAPPVETAAAPTAARAPLTEERSVPRPAAVPAPEAASAAVVDEPNAAARPEVAEAAAPAPAAEAPVALRPEPVPAASELTAAPARTAEAPREQVPAAAETSDAASNAAAAPGVEVAPAPVVEAKAAPATEAPQMAAPRRRPAGASRRAGVQAHWSHQAVLESFASATIQSKHWKLHGFRIVPEILAALKDRINADRRSTGNSKLAISHYLDAVLRHTPTDVDQQIALAQEFLTARMGMVEAGKQSTYRVGPQASAWVSDMNAGLQEADYGRKGIYVVSASIESFLGELDGSGALQRPELPGR